MSAEPRYEHTIRWVYGLVPYGRRGDARDRWVTYYFEREKHWDALEEHLAALSFRSAA